MPSKTKLKWFTIGDKKMPIDLLEKYTMRELFSLHRWMDGEVKEFEVMMAQIRNRMNELDLGKNKKRKK